MTRASSTTKPTARKRPEAEKPRAPRDDERGQKPMYQRRDEYEPIGDGCYHRMPAKPHD